MVLAAHHLSLQVPLDYTQPNRSTAAIALLRVPSALSPGDKSYRGPILINPGGPGESGVDHVLSLGTSLQQLFGKEYDVVGFDPRLVSFPFYTSPSGGHSGWPLNHSGIGRTTPFIRGFTSASELFTFSIKVEEDPLLGSTPDAVARTYARFASFGQVAAKRLKDIGPYLGTPFVARDMLAITKAHGFDKLVYYGISYGTTLGMWPCFTIPMLPSCFMFWSLGATFATMFPNNVGRIIIDGVTDGDSYYSGQWDNNLVSVNFFVFLFLLLIVATVTPTKVSSTSTSNASKLVSWDVFCTSALLKP
jgi:pimeloyl-ACP methyl ester carboxylesterase